MTHGQDASVGLCVCTKIYFLSDQIVPTSVATGKQARKLTHVPSAKWGSPPTQQDWKFPVKHETVSNQILQSQTLHPPSCRTEAYLFLSGSRSGAHLVPAELLPCITIHRYLWDAGTSPHLHRFLPPSESANSDVRSSDLGLVEPFPDHCPLDEAGSGLRKREVVETGYVDYRGVETYGDVTSYLGIPYAEPPLGNLRFRAPEPLDTARVLKETGGNVVDAPQYPDFCVHGPLFSK